MNEPNFSDTPIGFLAEHIGNLQQVLREGRRPTYEEAVLVKNLQHYLPKLFDIATKDGDENGLDACFLVKQQLPIIVAGFMQSCGIDPTPVVNPGTDDAAAKAAVLRLMAASMQDGEAGKSAKPAKRATVNQRMSSQTVKGSRVDSFRRIVGVRRVESPRHWPSAISHSCGSRRTV